MLICGSTGHVVAAKGITLYSVNVPPESGKLIVAVADSDIQVWIDLPTHTTTMKASGMGTENKQLHIRVPVGVRIFLVEQPADQGATFVSETSDGYNIVPLYLPKGSEVGQCVQELVLATTHVPPRLTPAEIAKIGTQPAMKVFKTLDPQSMALRLEQDNPDPQTTERSDDPR
jgi:hypothetical protein